MSDTDTATEYNYSRFTMASDPVDYAGPKAGEEMPPWEGVDVNGKSLSSASFEGKYVVMETGSYTCPIYASAIEEMTNLTEEFPEVAFLVIYTREAHPGARFGAHTSMDGKKAAAQLVRNDYHEKRTIVVDDLEGSIHQALGGLPNQFYVLSPSGRVMMRGDWSKPQVIADLLRMGDPDLIIEHQFYAPKSPPFWKFFGVIRKGGIGAIWDFVRSYGAFRRQQKRKEKHRIATR